MVLSMKKRFLLLLILAAILISAASASHDMEIIPLSSPVYEYMESLYVLEGKAAPQGAKPWTVADVKQQLDRITPTSVPAQNLYDILSEYTDSEDEKNVKVDVDMSLTPSLGLHINNTDFDESGKWRSQVLNDKLLHLNGSLYVYDYFAADMGLSVGLMNSVQAYNTGKNPEENDKWYKSEHEDRFSERMSSNIPFLSPGDIDVDVTDNSYISVGVPYISLSLGRGQLSLGNGKMGNLILGNTLPYHDYLSISASNNTWFDYTMLMSFFTHPMNYIEHRISGKESDINGIQMFIAHRFEMRMFSDKLRLSINEATMYQSEDNTIDFRVFNPLLIMHGYYISANANSLASIELEFAPFKNFQLYASFAIDDLSVNEKKAPEPGATLNMWGVMGGMRVSVPAKKGYFTLGLEAVYTTPFMYHKDSYGNADYSLDFIGTVGFMHGNKKVYNRQYLSFPFGSDALAALLDVSYTNPMRWSIGMNLFAMAHGITNITTKGEIYQNNNSGKLPGWIMTENPFTGDKGEISYTFDIGFNAKCYLMRNLSVSAAADFIYVVNMDNKAGQNRQDLQFTLAVEYDIF